jgi:tRNA (cytidine/uridine-2'-O-)-methyltransferase
VWPSWQAFEKELPALGDAYFFSARAKRVFWDVPLGASPDVVLIFGGETTGLSADLHERYEDRFVGMPIASLLVRSLNLSTAVALAVYEVIRKRRAAAQNLNG